jgi:hypothetical protein
LISGATLALIAMVALPVGSASANVGSASSITVPTAATVGQTGIAASFTIINTNTPPNEAESNAVVSLRLALSCGAIGSSTSACGTPDPGVFDAGSQGVGAAGTACAGKTFTISAPDASGIVTFTPSSSISLAPPGSATGTDRCTVNFFYDVVKQPTIDVDAPMPGIQTWTNGLFTVRSETSMLTVSNTPHPERTVTIPDVARTVTIGFDGAGFTGVVESSESACVDHQKVIVKQRLAGPDALVGKGKTDASGNYAIGASPSAGKYYAKLGATTIPGVANCSAARSATLNLE